MRTHVIRTVPVLLIAALSACAASSGLRGPNEFLDEKTAATVSVVAKPLVFARERPELAAHSRDYVTLAAASVNRSGTIEYFLFAYFWSTVDPRTVRSDRSLPDELTIAADDRLIHPQLAGHSAQDAGVGSAVRAPPGHRWTLNVYRSDPATLRYMAEVRRLKVIVGSAPQSSTFEIWDDQRRSLRALVP